MIQAQQVQHRRVQIVQMDFILHGVVAVIVGRAVAESRLHAAAGHPHRIAMRVVVAAVVTLRRRRATKFTSPQDQRLVEQAPGLQVAQQAGDGPVDLGGIRGVVFFQIRRAGPTCSCA